MADGDTSASTLSHPGPNWHILWPSGGLSNIQLDVVGFLAILGEDAVKKTSRLASLSWVFLLPRLIPAPHSLLYSERPEELDVYRASVCSAYSGNVRDHLSHVAGAIFAPMPTFTVRCCEIQRRPAPIRHSGTRVDGPTQMRANLLGPHVFANILGCALSVALLVLSVILGDGMSLLATILLSGVSVFAGITNRWQLTLPKAPGRYVPPGDTIIRWPNGSYLIVRCSEQVARELFFRPESIDYTLQWANGFILLSLVGTLFLMVSVVALANAKIELQIAWAVSYIALNIAHWIAAALPRGLNWDFSAYQIKEQSIAGGPQNKNFTEALWKAILVTKDIRWVRLSKAAPQTAAWDEWLVEAETEAQLCGFHEGALVEPIWTEKSDGTTGRVWECPAGWDPTAAFARIMIDRGAAMS